MTKKEWVISVILTLFSVTSSIVFIVYGIGIALGEGVPIWITGFAIITGLYGIGSILSILWAWVYGGVKTTQIVKRLAITFLALFILGSMDVGIISGLEVVGILGVAAVLWLNWFSVRYIANRRANA